ncbi:MAG: choice-of-anchor L domain-containing protein [Bacteroidota bacterium]
MKKSAYSFRLTLTTSLLLYYVGMLVAQNNITVIPLSQLQGVNGAQLVEQSFIANTLEATDITYNGNVFAFGTFENTADLIDLDSGLVLSTGNVATLLSIPNNPNGETFNLPGDADLDALSQGGSTNDVAVIEFDFIASDTSFGLRYIYGSADYEAFVCGEFDDPIGIFVSGPGLDGPFSGGAVNVAVVPGTTDVPVTVNTINDGMADGASTNCINANPLWQQSTIYYDPMPSGATLAGATVALETKPITLLLDSTYHIKIAIGDKSDFVFNSYLFLEPLGAFVSLPSSSIDTIICSGETIIIEEQEFDSSGIYAVTLVDQMGNDSAIVLLTLEVLPTDESLNELTTCLGDTLVVEGISYSSDTTIVSIYTNVLGCDSLVGYVLNFEPLEIIADEVPEVVCVGDTLSLIWGDNFGASNEDEPTYMQEEMILIPDGTGEIVSSTITIDDFPASAVIDGLNTISSICMTIEHSWMFDLDIVLQCPDGLEISLQTQEFISQEVFLGIPFEEDDITNGDVPGIGYTYCWTPDAPLSWTEAVQTLAPQVLPPGDYAPSESLSGLLGCPLNGNWRLLVSDLWGADNGYLFDWSITFDGDVVDDELDDPTNRDWLNVPDGAVVATADSLIFVFEEVGNYSFTYVVEDSTGCFGERTFEVEAVDVVEELIEVQLCDGETFQFNGVTYDSAGIYTSTIMASEGCDSRYTIIIEIGESVVVDVQTISCIDGEGGIFTEVYTTASGCDSTVIREVIYEPFATDFDIQVQPDTCEGGEGSIFISWEGGEENYENLSVGTYNVTVGNSEGCVEQLEVEVPAVGDPPIADFNFTLEEEERTLSFTNLSDNAATYVWDFGDGFTDTQASPVHTYTAYGTYAICLTAISECGESSYCEVIELLEAPTPFVIELDSTEIVMGGAVALAVSLPFGGTLGAFSGTIRVADGQVVHLTGLNPAALGDGEFIYTPLDHTAIAFSFTSNSIDGLAVEPGAILFTISAQAVGQAGEASTYALAEPQVSRLEDGVIQPLPVTQNTGFVQILSGDSQFSGTILTTLDHMPPSAPIENVWVNIIDQSGIAFDTVLLTDNEGMYFNEGYAAGTYEAKPTKDDGVENGISVGDLIQVLQHTLGIFTIDTPYNLLAADVTCDAIVDQEDVDLLFDLLLGEIGAFPDCPSWIFMPQDYLFQDPTDPYDYPSSILFDLGENDLVNQLDFYGVKKGDVTRDALPRSTIVTQDSLIFSVNNGAALVGDTIVLSFEPDEFESLFGFQFALSFPADSLRFLDVTDVVLPGASSTLGVVENMPGSLRVIWFSPTGGGVTVPSGDAAFKLRFIAREALDNWGLAIEMDNAQLVPEAYNATSGPTLPLLIQFDDLTDIPLLGSSDFYLLQNQPNPFDSRTQIRFHLPMAMPSTLLIHNQLGQVVWQEQALLQAGPHERWVGGLASGVYYCTLRTPFGAVTKKMVCVE